MSNQVTDFHIPVKKDVTSLPSGGKKELADISSDCFLLILQLRASSDYGNAKSLKSKILNLLEKIEKTARSSGIDNEKIKNAKFALVAFLDETVISSSWREKDEWLSEPLQIMLFDTFNAGEEFFDKLKLLRQASSKNKEVLEIYYLCLALGFKGKYQLQSPENLRRIIDDLNLELHPEIYTSPGALSPNGKPREYIIESSSKKIPIWIYPAAVVIISILFYMYFSNSISDFANKVVQGIRGLI